MDWWKRLKIAVSVVLVPDGRQSLDGGPGSGIAEIPEGGISLERLATLGNDAAWIQLGGQDHAQRHPWRQYATAICLGWG